MTDGNVMESGRVDNGLERRLMAGILRDMRPGHGETLHAVILRFSLLPDSPSPERLASLGTPLMMREVGIVPFGSECPRTPYVDRAVLEACGNGFVLKSGETD